ncbi:MAG: HAD-IA family hydrolase [Defluviitaleaceae bacterium]|nr:HAD-IA family hydrolase [Defluviitaleaceae bacterium]
MIKSVLFDFDGVLTLDANGTQTICNYICSTTRVDRSVFEHEYRKFNADLQTGKVVHEEIWKRVCDAVGQHIDIKILNDSFDNTPINSYMLKLAKEIKELGLKIGIVTDNKADRIKSIVDFHNWHNVFDGIVVSAEVGSGKTHPAIFHKIFSILSVNPNECVFIDNTEKNLVVPKELGVTTIFFEHEKNDISKLRNELYNLGIPNLAV